MELAAETYNTDNSREYLFRDNKYTKLAIIKIATEIYSYTNRSSALTQYYIILDNLYQAYLRLAEKITSK